MIGYNYCTMQPVIIHQPAPCNENWDAMTPTEAGRHCAACQTQVVDFTHMTDGEVLAFLRHTIPGNRCGLFREDQVGRPLVAAPPVTRLRRWTGALILLLGSILGKAWAKDEHSGPHEMAQDPVAAKPTAFSVPDSLFLVRGVVRNQLWMRIEGASVRITGKSGFADTTDAQGYFRILVPQSSRGEFHYIRLNYNGPHHTHLTARVAFDSIRTKPYRIRLKKAPKTRAPGFY